MHLKMQMKGISANSSLSDRKRIDTNLQREKKDLKITIEEF